MPRLYLGNLPRKVEERDIKKFLSDYGRIRSIDLKNGYGFVEVEDKRDADDAIHDLDGSKMLGERVTVEMARSSARFGNGGDFGGANRGRFDSRDSRDNNSRRPIRSEHRIIVEELSTRVSWQDLKDLMRKVGEVSFADAHKLRKNEGVVEFSNHSDMKAAISKYDGYELHGYKLRVYEDKKNGSRKRSKSRSKRRRSSSSSSRSRSRKSRSRSRSRKSRSRTRSRSRGKRSSSRRRSRSIKRSNSRKKSVSKSRTKSRSGSKGGFLKSKSASKKSDTSRKRSASRSKSGSPKKGSDKNGGRSRSGSKPIKVEVGSDAHDANEDKMSDGKRSVSGSGGKRSRSGSGGKRSVSGSKSRSCSHSVSRSRSRSPQEKNSHKSDSDNNNESNVNGEVKQSHDDSNNEPMDSN